MVFFAHGWDAGPRKLLGGGIVGFVAPRLVGGRMSNLVPTDKCGEIGRLGNENGSKGRTRTYNHTVNSRVLYH